MFQREPPVLHHVGDARPVGLALFGRVGIVDEAYAVCAFLEHLHLFRRPCASQRGNGVIDAGRVHLGCVWRALNEKE